MNRRSLLEAALSMLAMARLARALDNSQLFERRGLRGVRFYRFGSR